MDLHEFHAYIEIYTLHRTIPKVRANQSCSIRTISASITYKYLFIADYFNVSRMVILLLSHI